MVNVTKGILVECDPAMKQVLLSIYRDFHPIGYISVSSASWWEVYSWLKIYHPGDKFYFLSIAKKTCFQDLDETHLFISPDVLEQLKAQIDDLMDKISVPIVEGVEKKWKLNRNWELRPSTRWRYRRYFEGDCRKWTVPQWSEELRPASNWGSRIYQSNIFFCHLTQCSPHNS